MDQELPVIEILGVPIACLEQTQALKEIQRLHERTSPALVAYLNAHTLNLASRSPSYRALLNRTDLNLNDGSGVALAARLQGRRFKENLNGSDFNRAILREAARLGWSVYLLGAAQGVADLAARRLTTDIKELKVVGTRSGYFTEAESNAVVEEIRGAGADLLLVAMGNPRQEEWLAAHLPATGARVGIGVGAFLDFSAEVVPRAPRWMSKAGVEWLWRLGQEPRRMWRRYVLGNPMFLARVVKDRLADGRGRKVDV
jgi:exopolysaccharide biosynthesis WecB/TagA/CpsF family protein